MCISLRTRTLCAFTWQRKFTLLLLPASFWLKSWTTSTTRQFPFYCKTSLPLRLSDRNTAQVTPVQTIFYKGVPCSSTFYVALRGISKTALRDYTIYFYAFKINLETKNKICSFISGLSAHIFICYQFQKINFFPSLISKPLTLFFSFIEISF